MLTVTMCQPDECDADHSWSLPRNSNAEKEYWQGFGMSNVVQSRSGNRV